MNSAGTLLYVADSCNNCIRVINLVTLATSLLADDSTKYSYQEETYNTAWFSGLRGVCLYEASGRLYVSDYEII
ncbi:MAG: hypothetical protein LLG37_03085 [Spirochaetia bacterium]|nr:hypothetical protein [Spirochaetia bacterium]